MTSKPPGWYDDGHGALRWWDGSAWTEHVATPDPDADGEGELPPELADFLDEGSSEDGESGGAFVAATGPERSKLWIVWVVLGVVLLGIVIAAAVLIPLLFLNLATSSQGVAPQTDDERSAVAAIEQYNDAWLDGDCERYVDVTSERFRSFENTDDCAAFEASAQSFSEMVEDYSISVTGIGHEGDTVQVETVERYGSYLGPDGEVSDQTHPFVDRWTYVLIPDGEGWVIDEALS